MMLRRQALEASDEACRQELERACQDRPALRQAGGGEAAAIKGTMRLRPALFDRRTHRRCRWIGPMETGAAPRPLSAQPVRPGLPMQSPSLGAPSDCADRSSLSKAVDTRRHDPGTTLPSYTSPAFPRVFERTWQVPAGRGGIPSFQMRHTPEASGPPEPRAVSDMPERTPQAATSSMSGFQFRFRCGMYLTPALN